MILPLVESISAFIMVEGMTDHLPWMQISHSIQLYILSEVVESSNQWTWPLGSVVKTLLQVVHCALHNHKDRFAIVLATAATTSARCTASRKAFANGMPDIHKAVF